MKIDVSYAVFDETARAMLLEAGMKLPESENVSLKRLLCQALVNGVQDERPTAEEKLKRFEILTKIHAATDVVELTAEDITVLKKIVGAAYPTLAVGQIYKLLEAGIQPIAEKVT